jgi:hypothetical protein
MRGGKFLDGPENSELPWAAWISFFPLFYTPSAASLTLAISSVFSLWGGLLGGHIDLNK